MSAFKHTPGPWRLTLEDGDNYIRAANGQALMCDMQYYPWVNLNDADWRLIAAAPDLLAALRDLTLRADNTEVSGAGYSIDTAWAHALLARFEDVSTEEGTQDNPPSGDNVK